MAVYEKWARILYGTLTVGKDDVGHDVKFYGATSGKYLLWDESADSLLLLGTFAPATSDGATLGSTSLMWSDLFLASGAVINFNADEITMTHSTIGTGGKIKVETTWGTAAATGRPFEVSLIIDDVRLGSYANAFKAFVDCGASGGSQGVLSASNHEMDLPTTSGGEGVYTCVEHEMVAPEGFNSSGCILSWMYFNAAGTDKADVYAVADLFHIDSGVVAGTGSTLGTGSSTLRIGLGANAGTKRYIPLSTAAETYTTAYPIATTSTIISTCTTAGISCSASTLNASSGRIGKFIGSVAAAAQGDGYGVFEMQANFSGTVPSGSVANAASFWINFAGASVTAGTMICVQNNGIWMPSGLTVSTTNLIIGMRMHCEVGGGTQPQRISCFSINVPANHITSLYQINVIEDINTTGTKSGSSVAVPWLMTAAGTVYYVNAFTS